MYISNTSVITDCVLTRRGRALLSRGDGSFKITHFALGDTEIDYTLYNTDHPGGSQFYGSCIENMPITEALTDETVEMRFLLTSLPKKTIRIPVVSVPQSTFTLSPGQNVTISPQTVNYTEGNTTFGYSFILADSDVCSMYVSETAPGQQYAGTGNISSAGMTENEMGSAIVLTGKSVVITANMLQLAARSTTLTIVGNETGGRVVVNITVKKVTTNTTPNAPLTGNAPISLP